MLTPGELARRVDASEGVEVEASAEDVDIVSESRISFLQWGAIIAGALIAAALSLVLITFGSAIGLAVLSSAPTWRDASPALAVASGIYLLLTALASFGLGGYAAGRLRERWHRTAPANVVEFRDGVHGVLAWAIAVVVSGLVITAAIAGAASKAVEPATSPTATTGEPLIAYELDRLFRGERSASEADLNYSRAEAGRILLAATGRQGITAEDRTYLARLVAGKTGIALPDAEHRVDLAIAGATTAVQKARRSAVILGFSTAASLLLGAAAAGYAATAGGRHRDNVAPSLTWRWAL
jgi:hypothetical protein